MPLSVDCPECGQKVVPGDDQCWACQAPLPFEVQGEAIQRVIVLGETVTWQTIATGVFLGMLALSVVSVIVSAVAYAILA